MAKKMLIDATHPEETRVVVVDGQKVDDFDFESITKRQLAGNIYLAKVTRVEPSLQAAFVEYGGNRHGFLAFAEIHPDYYQIPVADREALLAEEEREEEARRAREEEDEAKPKRSRERKPRKERTRGRKKKDDSSDEAAAAVAGLEVIDVVADVAEGDSPAGLEVTDVVENAPGGMEVTDLASDASDDTVETVEIAEASQEVAEDVAEAAPDATEETEIEAASDEPVEAPADAAEDNADDAVKMAEAPAADDVQEDAVVADAAADEAPEDSPVEDENSEETAPKTIAESAGLEDEEAVTELVGEPASAQTLTGDAAAEAVEEAVAPSEDVAEAPAKEAQAEAAPAEAATEDAASADAVVEEAAPEEVAAAEGAADAPVDADAAPDQPEAETAEAEAEAPKPKRRRSRKSKKDEAKAEETKAEEPKQEDDTPVEARKSDDDEAPDSDDDDSAPEEVDEVGAEDTLEEVAKARTRLRRKYKIQDVIKVRQIMLVQVVKEERGNKGAALTTYLSLAGRYCVLMPNTARGGGISRKITNASDRKRLREVTSAMDVPKGMGLIVRTAGAERTKAEIKRDYEFLIRQWEQIRDLTLQSVAPTLIYEEGSLIKRSIRDVYSKEIDQILVEGETGYREAKEYMKMLMPSHAKNVQPYTDQIPLFSRYQVESYLNGMFNPTVQLKSGGYIVIGVTEALVAIDVNSGRATKQGSIEETALQTNLEAADEVARQARLRDLAGLIVIDFIDMDENRNNRAVEKRMKDRLKNDRARIQVGRISAFGLMEMSRQRLRPGMLEATTQPCPHCHGTGLIRSDENLSLSILREVEEEALRGRADEIVVRAPVDVANYLINNKRQHVAQLEQRHEITVAVMAVTTLMSPKFEIERSKTSTRQAPRVPDVISATSVAEDVVEEAEVVDEERDGDDGRSRRRRGKRGGRRKRGEGHEAQGEEQSQTEARSSEDGDEDGDGRRGRRRRRRGGRGRRNNEDQAPNAEAQAEGAVAEDQVSEEAVSDADAPAVEAEPVAEEAQAEATEVEATADAPDADVAEAEPEAEDVPEVEAEPELETAGTDAPASEAQPEESDKPKRRGWWSFGRN